MEGFSEVNKNNKRTERTSKCSYLNKKALLIVQKLHHQGSDEQTLQQIPHDPVTFVNIIYMRKSN